MAIAEGNVHVCAHVLIEEGVEIQHKQKRVNLSPKVA